LESQQELGPSLGCLRQDLRIPVPDPSWIEESVLEKIMTTYGLERKRRHRWKRWAMLHYELQMPRSGQLLRVIGSCITTQYHAVFVH